MGETYAPTLLDRRTKKLRKETGNTALKSKLDVGLMAKDLFWFSIARPTKMLLFSPIVLYLSIIVSINYGILYIFFTTLTEVFENIYHFEHDLVGLSFVGIGIGQFIGQFAYSYLAGKSYKKHAIRGDEKPEQRLHLMIVGSATIPIGLFWYGWSVQARAHWINPCIGAGVFSLGLIFIWVSQPHRYLTR
jgi:Major Facilitator Superfamily